MSAANDFEGRIRFGAYEVDLQSGELRCGGLKVKLQPQPFRILTLLLEHPGEVVTRERLRDELWPEDTHVEFDMGMNAAIKKLRRSIGDSAQHPRFVETLPRIGYRFVFPVERIAQDSSPREDAAPSAEPELAEGLEQHATDRPRRAVRWKLVVAAASLIVAASALAGLLSSSSWRSLIASGERSEEMKFAYRFYVGSRVSPDGSMLAYRDGETAHLWIVDFSTGERRELVSDWVSSALTWSHDSRRIAFIKLGDQPRGVEIVDVASGERARIPTDPARRLTPYDWASDGRIVCTVRSEEDWNIRQVAFFEPENGIITPIRTVRSRSNSFRLSPDHRFITYAERIAPTEVNPAVQSDIRLVSVHGDGPAVTLSDHPEPELYPFWSLDGRRVFFARDSGPPKSLWSVDIDPASGEPAGPPVQVSPLGRLTIALLPSVSPTGELFISRQSKGRAPIHLLRVDPLSGSPIGEPSTDFPESSSSPHWSDDGRWLRYRAAPPGISRAIQNTNDVERNIETGEERMALRRKARVSPPPWHYSESQGGGWAVFADRRSHEIRRELFESGKTETLLETPEPISGLEAFNDGREILFSTHSAGRDIHKLKVLRLSDRSIRDLGVSRQPPQWVISPDGREVAVSDLNCLVILRRYGGEAQELTCAPPPRLPSPGEFRGVVVNYTWWTDLTPSWSPDGSKIAWTVTDEEKRRVELWIVDRRSGTHETAWAGSENFYTLPRQPSWSPDGRHIAFSVQRYSDNEVWVMRGLM